MYFKKIFAVLDINQVAKDIDEKKPKNSKVDTDQKEDKSKLEKVKSIIKKKLVKTHPDKAGDDKSRTAYNFYTFLLKHLNEKYKKPSDFDRYFDDDSSAQSIDDTLDLYIQYENQEIRDFYNTKIKAAEANHPTSATQSNAAKSSNNNNNKPYTPPPTFTPFASGFGSFNSPNSKNFSSTGFQFPEKTADNAARAGILNYFADKYLDKKTDDLLECLRQINYIRDNITLCTKKIGIILNSYGSNTNCYENESLFTIVLSKTFVPATTSFFNLLIPILIDNKDILMKSNPIFENRANQIGTQIVYYLKTKDGDEKTVKNLLDLLEQFKIKFDANQILEALITARLLNLAKRIIPSLDLTARAPGSKPWITQIIEHYPYPHFDDDQLILLVNTILKKSAATELLAVHAGVPVIHQALQKKLPEKIISTLLCMSNANSLDAQGYPPLYYVIKLYQGNLPLLKELKELGANVNYKLPNGQTVLQFAESQPFVTQEMLHILVTIIDRIITALKTGIVNEKDKQEFRNYLRNNPLDVRLVYQEAINSKSHYAFELLVDLFDILDQKRTTTEIDLFIKSDVSSIDVITKLYDAPDDIDLVSVVKFIFEHTGIDQNWQMTFLKVLITHYKFILVAKLINFIVSITYKDPDIKSLLGQLIAFYPKQIEESIVTSFITQLYQKGCVTEFTHQLGSSEVTPLLMALKDKTIPLNVIKALAVKEVINVTDVSGNSPLYYAAMRGDAALVSSLLEKGADPQQIMKDGMTVLEHIKVLGEKSIIDCFEEKSETLIYNFVVDIKTYGQKDEKNFEKYFSYLEQYPQLLTKPLNKIFSNDTLQKLSLSYDGEESILDLVFIIRNMIPDTVLLKLIELFLNENLEKFTFTIASSTVSFRIYQVIEQEVNTPSLEALGEFCERNKVMLERAEVLLMEVCKSGKLWKIKPFIDSFKFTANDECIFDIVSNYPYEAFFQEDLVKLIEKIIMQCPGQLRQVKDQDSILIKALEKPIKFSTAVIKLLCCRETVNLPGKEKKSPLYYAVQQRDLELVRHFVSLGASVDHNLLQFARSNNVKLSIIDCLQTAITQNSVAQNPLSHWNKSNNNNNNTGDNNSDEYNAPRSEHVAR